MPVGYIGYTFYTSYSDCWLLLSQKFDNRVFGEQLVLFSYVIYHWKNVKNLRSNNIWSPRCTVVIQAQNQKSDKLSVSTTMDTYLFTQAQILNVIISWKLHATLSKVITAYSFLKIRWSALPP